MPILLGFTEDILNDAGGEAMDGKRTVLRG